MSEVTPPTPPTPPIPTAAQPTATVANPPDALVQQLALGARLEAVIAATAPRGQFEIETAFGRIIIHTGFPLPAAGPLQLQLLAKGPQLQFLITAIHGLPPQAALRALGLGQAGPAAAGGEAGTPQAGAPQAGTPQAASPQAASPQAGGGATPAAVSGAPAVGAPSVGEPAAVNLTVGATLAATLLRAGPALGAGTSQAQAAPGPSGAPSQAAPPRAASGAATPQAAQAGGRGPGSGLQAPPGTLFGVRIAAFQPATQAPGTGAGAGLPPEPAAPGGTGNLAPGNTLTGVVTGKAASSGHPIVQTHGGSLVIATRTPLPPGSTVTFEILSQVAPVAEAGKPAGVHPTALPVLLTERWSGLEEAINTLHAVNPALAQQLTHAVLPRPGATLAANVLFFMVALAGGDLRGWIGDGPARILQRVKPDLLSRLVDDFGRIRAVAEEPRPGGEWRAHFIPFMSGAEIEQIRLFMRPAGEDPEDDNEEGRKGTRFIIELDLSRMERFQLDGLVYQKDKHMDLIVRTENKLPQKIQGDIRDIFQEAGDVTGLKGGISFQAAPPHFIEILGAGPPEDHLGLTV